MTFTFIMAFSAQGDREWVIFENRSTQDNDDWYNLTDDYDDDDDDDWNNLTDDYADGDDNWHNLTQGGIEAKTTGARAVLKKRAKTK